MLVDNFKEAKEEILKHVGIVEGDIYLINIMTDCYWALEDDAIVFAEEERDIVNDTGNYYSDDCYCIHEGKDYTAVLVDRHNSILMLCDNKKRIANE